MANKGPIKYCIFCVHHISEPAAVILIIVRIWCNRISFITYLNKMLIKTKPTLC